MVAVVDVGFPTAAGRAPPPTTVPDFEQLLGSTAWARLPAAVRARFAADAHLEPTVYRGTACVRASVVGRLLAHVCRCLGTPVAPYVGDDVSMTVRVYRDAHGIVWEREYAFSHRTCIVRSTKEAREGVLVEKLGAGLHMQLRVQEQNGELHFVSDGYFFQIGRWRLDLPDGFLPGGTRVAHIDLGAGRFRFTMRTQHRWLGELYYQDGIFM
jgi:hypothetical protein